MPDDVEGEEPSLDRTRIEQLLTIRGVPSPLATLATSRLPDAALGVLLYGSFARGEPTEYSDVDLLVLTRHRVVPPRDERLSMHAYSPRELADAAGTLFAYHLRRDGIALQGSAALAGALDGAVTPDAPALLARLRQLGAVLGVSAEHSAQQVSGLVRVAKYLLRSALYATAIVAGQPSFSVAELARRAGEPRLAGLLSSHPGVGPAPSDEVLRELRERLVALVGSTPDPPGASLEAVAVNAWDDDRDLARLAVLALGDEVQVPYDQIGRVLL